ncbi:hypothetical protein ABW20_dc0110032 [Dactylellina cionopaga]|nr:hypothetical protein ABW20_dc0110032 [Dactylellina cionopaga]
MRYKPYESSGAPADPEIAVSGWSEQDGNNRLGQVFDTLQRINESLEPWAPEIQDGNGSDRNIIWCHFHQKYEPPILNGASQRSATTFAAIFWHLPGSETGSDNAPTACGEYTCWCGFQCVSDWSQRAHDEGRACPYRAAILDKWSRAMETDLTAAADLDTVQLACNHFMWALRDRILREGCCGSTWEFGLGEGIVAITKKIIEHSKDVLETPTTTECNASCKTYHILDESRNSKAIISYVKKVVTSPDIPATLRQLFRFSTNSRFIAAVAGVSKRLPPVVDAAFGLAAKIDEDYEGQGRRDDLFLRIKSLSTAAQSVSVGWAAVWLAGMVFLSEQSYLHSIPTRDIKISFECARLARSVDAGIWAFCYDVDDNQTAIDSAICAITNDLLGVRDDVAGANTVNQVCAGALSYGPCAQNGTTS